LLSNGFVTPEQIEETREVIEKFSKEVESVAVLIHHHFYKLDNESESLSHSLWQRIEGQTLKLRKRKKLLKYLGELGVQTVFHGHVHEQKDYSMKGLRIVNSGGSVYGVRKQNVFFNLVQLEKNNTGVEIRKYKYRTHEDSLKRKLFNFPSPVTEQLVAETAG
jgi:predicted phosphodiesterase